MGQGFGEDKIEQRQAKLEQKKDLLVRLGEVIEWEAFRASLERVHEKPRKSTAGRKTHDVIVMFKLLILQQLYNISDEELEYQVNDRLSFMRFLELGIGDTVPDATSVVVPQTGARVRVNRSLVRAVRWLPADSGVSS